MTEKLIQIMVDQEKHLRQLLQLLKIQKDLIMKKDAFGLEGLVEKLNECSKLVAKDELARRKSLNNADMKQFVSNANNEELSNVYAKITSVLNEVILQKDTNNTLIKQQISLNAKLLEIINPNREVKTYNSYGKY